MVCVSVSAVELAGQGSATNRNIPSGFEVNLITSMSPTTKTVVDHGVTHIT